MGRLPRSRKEVEAVKAKIIDEALKMIADDGYDGFSIRKLGPKLGMAPKTVYNYFQNKDELYLHVLTQGFETLYNEICQQAESKEDPFDQLVIMAETFIRFGFEQSNYYDLMFTLHVPKSNNYLGTPLEEPAQQELKTALKVMDLFVLVMEKIATRYGTIAKEEARLSVIQLLVGLHGIVALHNNSIMDYLQDPTVPIVDQLLHRILIPFNPHPA